MKAWPTRLGDPKEGKAEKLSYTDSIKMHLTSSPFPVEVPPRHEKKAARRYARIRVGMCDPKLLSYFDWMRYCDQKGYWSRYDIQFEVEGRTMVNTIFSFQY